MTPTVDNLGDIPVARVKAQGGPEGAKEAFVELESRMPSLRGRKMYGVFYVGEDAEDYYACVKLDEDHADDMGLERATIPGGRYARRRIKGWSGNEHQIATWFQELEQECLDSGLELDRDRPGVEFYRSTRDMIIMVPVKQ